MSASRPCWEEGAAGRTCTLLSSSGGYVSSCETLDVQLFCLLQLQSVFNLETHTRTRARTQAAALFCLPGLSYTRELIAAALE